MGKRHDNKGRILRTGETQRKDLRYQYQYTDDTKKRHCIYAKTLKELREKEDKIRFDTAQGLTHTSSKMTLNNWFNQWIKVYKKGKLKDITYNHYIEKWNTYVRDDIGNTPITKIKQIHIIDFYTRLQTNKNLSKGTIKIIHNLLRQSLEQAVDNDYILKNPCKNALKDINAVNSHYKDALTLKEQVNFFSFIDKSDKYSKYKPIFMLLFGSGLRIGEALALTWSDIDFSNNSLTVNKTLHYQKIDSRYQFRITVPKTRNSIRTVPLINDIKLELLQERQRQMSLGTRGKDMYYFDNFNGDKECVHDFVFTSNLSKPLNAHNINKIIKSIVKEYNKEESINAINENRKAELLREFSCHYTRHSFATRCFESGIQVKTVADILGHSTTNITQDIYTHVTEKQKQKEIKKLNIRIS